MPLPLLDVTNAVGVVSARRAILSSEPEQTTVGKAGRRIQNVPNNNIKLIRFWYKNQPYQTSEFQCHLDMVVLLQQTRHNNHLRQTRTAITSDRRLRRVSRPVCEFQDQRQEKNRKTQHAPRVLTLLVHHVRRQRLDHLWRRSGILRGFLPPCSCVLLAPLCSALVPSCLLPLRLALPLLTKIPFFRRWSLRLPLQLLGLRLLGLPRELQGGERGQITFAPATETFRDRDITNLSTGWRNESTDSSSKFGIVVLSAQDKKLLCLGIKRGGGGVTPFASTPSAPKPGTMEWASPPQDLGTSGGLYIMKNTASAFCSPVVPMDMATPEVVNKLKMEKHSLNDWIEKFLVLRRLDYIKSEGSLSGTTFEEEETKVVKATIIDTPFTTTKTIRRTTASFAVENFSPHRKILEGDISEVVSKVQQDPTIIPTVVREVEDSVTEAGELIRALSKDQAEVKKDTGLESGVTTL